MTTHTLIINQQQKELIVKALEIYSQLLVGQTAGEQLAASKLISPIRKASSYSPTNLADIAE